MRHREWHRTERIGWLRAAVLGANDGIVSTASLVVGIAAAHSRRNEILLAGVAGLVSGALSMAAGEYVSVSSQADTEGADLALERTELATQRSAEEKELAAIYVKRGLEPALARTVALQLMAHDALGAHARRRTWPLRETHRPSSAGSACVRSDVLRGSRGADPRGIVGAVGQTGSCCFRYVADVSSSARCTGRPHGRCVPVGRRRARRILGRLGDGRYSWHRSPVRYHSVVTVSCSRAVRATGEASKHRGSPTTSNRSTPVFHASIIERIAFDFVGEDVQVGPSGI